MKRRMEPEENKPPHPGEMIERVLLRNYKLTIPDVARRSEIEASELRKIVSGNSDVTRNVADHLSQVFGRAAETLFQMQKVYNFYQETGRRPSPSEKRKLSLG